MRNCSLFIQSCCVCVLRARGAYGFTLCLLFNTTLYLPGVNEFLRCEFNLRLLKKQDFGIPFCIFSLSLSLSLCFYLSVCANIKASILFLIKVLFNSAQSRTQLDYMLAETQLRSTQKSI